MELAHNSQHIFAFEEYARFLTQFFSLNDDAKVKDSQRKLYDF